MRLDYGLAEARVHGWIPLRADLDVWAGDAHADAFEQLPERAAELLAVPGMVPSGNITVTVERDAAPADIHARGMALRAPHHVTVHIGLGGDDAKPRVYRDSVRAALHDLVTSARTGCPPRAGINAGHAAVTLAAHATRAMRAGITHRLPEEPPCPAAT